jgi:hypothetical protein
MKERGRSVTLIMLAAIAVAFIACNRAHNAASAQSSAQPATGVIARPTQQASPPSPPATAQPPQAAGVENHTATETQAAPAAPSSATPSPATAVDAPAPKTIASEHSESFTVAQHTFRMIIHVRRIAGAKPSEEDETVDWWELRNEKDQVVYRESYPVTFQNGGFESTVGISGRSFTTPQGGGILVHGGELPSAPNDGGWVQVFGFKYGRDRYGADESLFGAFGPPIYVPEGDFIEVGSDSYQPTPIFKATATVTVMNDVLRFRIWTGNFNIIYPVLINWITGKVQPARRCIETTSKGRVERCSYPVQVEAHRENQPTFVRLFPEADEGYTAKHIIVQPQSKVEYLEARLPVAWSEDMKAISFSVDNAGMWLKVRIDGQEGWVHSEEDFEALGLPQAG